MGQIKSLHWLMTLVIAFVQNTFIIEPLYTLVTTFVFIKLNQVTRNKDRLYYNNE